MNEASLATLSNNLVYSTMVVYAIAMVFYAYDLAFAGVRGRVLEAESANTESVEAETLATVGADAAPEGLRTLTTQSSSASLRDDRPAVRTKAGGIAASLTVLGTILLAGGVLTRGMAADRVPWGNMYEFSITACLAVMVVYLALSVKFDLRWMGVFVVTTVLLALGLAVTVLYVDAGQLVPALHSYWLAIHVTAAVISFGLFTVGAILSGLYIFAARHERKVEAGLKSSDGIFWSRVPVSESLDRIAYRIHAWVFPLWTFAVIAGAIWAESAWGRYWGWDPKETWAFITWVVYACYLHARATVGWKGTKAASIALLGYGCLLFNLVGVNIFFSGLHSYSGLPK